MAASVNKQKHGMPLENKSSMNFASYHEIMSPDKSKVPSVNMNNTIYNSSSITEIGPTKEVQMLTPHRASINPTSIL